MPDLPVYKCLIADDLESDLQVEFISIVDKPAIEKNFLAFNAQERTFVPMPENKMNFSVDDDKRIVSGPAMIADMLIYRNDPGGIGEYYTVFDAPSIMAIVQKFFKKGYVQNFNIMHDSEQRKNDITIFESFIVDTEKGKNPPKGYEDAKNGSWFISAKVDNDDTWAKVKAGELKGFSVEGIFKQFPVTAKEKMSAEKVLEQIQKLLALIPDGATA